MLSRYVHRIKCETKRAWERSEGEREREKHNAQASFFMFIFIFFNFHFCLFVQTTVACVLHIFKFLALYSRGIRFLVPLISGVSSRPAADLVFVQMRKYYFSKLAMRLYIDYFRFISMAVPVPVSFLFSSRKNEIFIIVFCIQTNIASLGVTILHAISLHACMQFRNFVAE